MKLIMAVSADGFVARDADDDMSWTGLTDKHVFRLLTSVGGVLGAGRKTFEQLPRLEGRTVICLSRKYGWVKNYEARKALEAAPGPGVVPASAANVRTLTLEQFNNQHPTGWLIGGQKVALEAFKLNLLDQVYLCRSREAFLHQGVVDRITARLQKECWRRKQSVRFFYDTSVEIWGKQ